MGLLAIICLDGNGSKFLENNKEFISKTKESGEIDIVCYTDKELLNTSRYERYQKSLGGNAQYYMFVNDSTLLPESSASILMNELEASPKILTLRIRAGKTIKYNDILNAKFPFYLPKYVFCSEFLNSVVIAEGEKPYFDEVLITEASSLPFVMSKALVNSTAEEYLETKLDKYTKGVDPTWYRQAVVNFIIPHLKTGTGKQQQIMLLYLIWNKFKCKEE